MTTFREDAARGPLVDIVVPGWNNLHLTRRLLASLEQTQGAAYHVIYVDNGSHPAELDSLIEQWPDLRVVRWPFNQGFVRGVNTGLALTKLSGAEFVLLLNNDVEVPAGDPDWLARLVEPFADPQVGAVGAVSDNVYGAQRRGGPRAGVSEAAVLIGFALCLRKEAQQQVGFFDERFEPGNYEDWDYSLRLRKAGWRLLVAESVWLRHAMHQTFRVLEREAELDFAALLKGNLAQLVAKWTPGGLAEMGIQVKAREPEAQT